MPPDLFIAAQVPGDAAFQTVQGRADVAVPALIERNIAQPADGNTASSV